MKTNVFVVECDMSKYAICKGIKVKVPLVFMADSPQVMLVFNPTVGCKYFLSGPRLPFQLQGVTTLGRYQFILLGD